MAPWMPQSSPFVSNSTYHLGAADPGPASVGTPYLVVLSRKAARHQDQVSWAWNMVEEMSSSRLGLHIQVLIRTLA